MSPSEEIPDVNDLARSMLVLYGPHHDDDEHGVGDDDSSGPYARGPLFPVEPEHYEAIRAATERDSNRYLHSGLVPVGCGYCGTTVEVKKIGPGYTAVQWNSTALSRCSYFAERRGQGYDSSRTRGCPHLTQSIRDAVAAGQLEETCSASGDGID